MRKVRKPAKKKNTIKLAPVIHHIEQQFGKRGTLKRERFELAFETYKLGVMIQRLRKEKGMTQEELAEKCRTTKNYISRIENNASDIRLSTLMRIIREGLGGQLKLTVDTLTFSTLFLITNLPLLYR